MTTLTRYSLQYQLSDSPTRRTYKTAVAATIARHQAQRVAWRGGDLQGIRIVACVGQLLSDADVRALSWADDALDLLLARALSATEAYRRLRRGEGGQ